MYPARGFVLWHAMTLLEARAAPTEYTDKTGMRSSLNHDTKLVQRQYNPMFNGLDSINAMVDAMAPPGEGFVESLIQAPARELAKISIYRTEATMAGGLEPETAAMSGALEPGAATSVEAAAADAGASAAEIGGDVFMGDLEYLPDPWDVVAVAEESGAQDIFSYMNAIASLTGPKPPPLTGGEGVQLPGTLQTIMEETGDAAGEMFEAIQDGVSGLAPQVGEDVAALVGAGVSAPMAAAFMIGVTAWATQWTVKKIKEMKKGWHEGLEGFGTLLKDALLEEFHVDLNAPLPNGFPVGDHMNGLTNQLYHIYASVGSYERSRLIQLGAPVQDFETPDHTQNVKAMKTWAQTENGQQWCEETKLHLVSGLEKLGISVDTSTMKVPLRKSCPPPGAPRHRRSGSC